MNQCVPSWDLDDPAAGTASGGLNDTVLAVAGTRALSSFSPLIVPMADQYYEVAELTWEKGNISSHGLLNRPAQPKPYPPPASSHSHQLQPIGGGGAAAGGDRETLEAVVGEAAARSHFPHLPLPASTPWLLSEEELRRKRARVVDDDGLVCASQGSAAPGRRAESATMPAGACGIDRFTNTNNSTSLDREDSKGSPDTENTSDWRCFSRRSQFSKSKKDGLCHEGENAVINGEPAMRSSVSTKRGRAAAIHNESERKRRDRINQKMKTLQKLVPNSSKTDKASMLDEVIDYLQQLQAQVQVMSRMRSMMMPMAMPQLQMSVMAQMAQGMMNMGSVAHPDGYVPLPMMHPPPPFIPLPWDAPVAGTVSDRAPQPMPDAFAAFLACQQAQAQNGQQQRTSMEAYNRMLAMCQKLNHQQQSQPSNSKQ